VTGGGLAGNLARVLPPGLVARVDRATWSPPAVFVLVARIGSVPQDQLELTFNLGVGMIAVVPRDRVDDALAVLASGQVPAWVAGDVAYPGSTAPVNLPNSAHTDQTPSQRTGHVEMASSYAGNPGFWGLDRQ
jgi:phosphoribosylformylglycinamidine cyclo-ligase